MATISRAQWGARPAAPAEPLDATLVVGLAFHWPGWPDATHAIRGISSVSAALRSWQGTHMDSKGMRDIAYQLAIDLDGNRYILRGLDGQSGANGDVDPNKRFGAVLLVLAPGEIPSEAMVREIQNVVRDHRALFLKSELLVGHQDVRPEPTTCPGPIVMRLIGEGVFEPGLTPAELLRADLNETMAPLKRALEKVANRPRLRFHLERAREAISKARKINRG